jgi:predicted RNase H-like nuclease
MEYAGADACSGGWAVVVVDGAGFLDSFTASTIEEADTALAARADVGALCVDIPIGIPDAGSRQADTLARSFIKPRGSSVFPTPVRAALLAGTYAEAREASVAASGKSLSAQAYAMRERILDVDGYVGESSVTIYEGHPEVSFRAMATDGLAESKKSYGGLALRYQLLKDEGIVVPYGIEKSLKGASTDDVLDAAAMAWTARRIARGEADRFPSAAQAERSSDGIDSAIWF